MGTVQLVNVQKSFGAVDVIHGIDLEVEDKEFVALVGPSGCGKSTLLRMIAGLEGVNSGDIYIGGVRVNGKRPKDRDIAMVFQNYALYPHMTVRQNMDLSMRIARRSRAEIEERVAQAATLLEISPLLERKPSQLSGGQRQRVAMGRALVRNPSVFLFDEPLSNLDAKLRVQMRSEIKALHEAVATTSIYVTHDQIEAMTLANRVVVLNRGRIEQIGSPGELYKRPANVFVAGFIGSPAMNLLGGVVAADGVSVRLDGSSNTLAIHPDIRVQPGQKVVVGVRPEDFALGDSPGIPGEILQVEPIGSHVLVKVGIDRNSSLTVLVDNERAVTKGDTVAMGVTAAKVHVFDATTELRL